MPFEPVRIAGCRRFFSFLEPSFNPLESALP